ncbi:MAG: hypothetical protein J7J82_07525 [Staphylothermus sp.]|nr:hypothetical protein [Staphylothermus sp.]
MEWILYLLVMLLLVIAYPVIRILYSQMPRESSKTPNEIKKIGKAVVMIRNGNVVELKKNVMVFEDGTILVDKDKLYKLEKKEPYLLRMGRNTYQLYILDANTNALYQFEDPPKDVKTGKLNPVVLNPKTLYNYIASHSIQKLLGKITVSKTEAILYMFTGMVIIILMIFFFMPLLGHEIIIR